jgi:hypothetical protein
MNTHSSVLAIPRMQAAGARLLGELDLMRDLVSATTAQLEKERELKQALELKLVQIKKASTEKAQVLQDQIRSLEAQVRG